MTSELKIGDLIHVPPVQTVIRLEGSDSQSAAIAGSFVFTPVVADHFSVLAEALVKDHGRGYFLQGDFGSGKSHFLAALFAWLSAHPGTERLTRDHRGLQALGASGRRFLPVAVSLVNFRASTSLEKILIEAIEAALAHRDIPVRLTPRSAFFRHLNQVLSDGGLAAEFAAQTGQPASELQAWIKTHPRKAYVEGVRFLKSMGLQAPETLVEERHETFQRAVDTVLANGFQGLVLIVDELSEFFRSKPDARGLNEDARTLQLLGELSGRLPVWTIAAVQESIERTGDIAQVTFRKIKDRFPVKFTLTTVHIRTLISRRLVERKEGAHEKIGEIYDQLRRRFSTFKADHEAFQTTYPVHPVTISLLDGLGDLFSEHRGIVDFVHTRLAGDPERKIPGILNRPANELLAPDSIYDHFSERMAEFSDFHIYPRHVIPHLDDTIQRLFENDADRELAARVVRMLVLYAIHPTAKVPHVGELTELAACNLWDHDPQMNIEFVAEALLDPLVEESKFLTKIPAESGNALETVYKITTREDPGKTLRARIARNAAELPADDSRLLLMPLTRLEESVSWPGKGLFEEGLHRRVTWRHSTRQAWVGFLTPGRETEIREKIMQQVDDGRADFAVLFTLAQTEFSADHTAVWRVKFPGDADNTPPMQEFLAAHLIATGLQPSNPAETALVGPAREAVKKLSPAAQKAALTCFYDGSFVAPAIHTENVLRQVKRFDSLLDLAAARLLEERYPGFRDIAPRKVIPTALTYQRLIDDFVSPGSLSFQKAHQRGLSDAIEGLATPLGLVELRSGSYVYAPDPEHHPLLSTLFRMIRAAGHTPMEDILSALATGPYGVPVETARFLLTALAHGGLITIIQNGRSVPIEMLGLMRIQKADAVAQGEMIGKNTREILLDECRFLAPPGGWDAFGLRQQREAWQGALKFREWARKTAADMRNRIASLSEFSAFESFELDTLSRQAGALDTLSQEIKTSFPAREGLERFISAYRESGLTHEKIDDIRKLQIFLSRHAEQYIFIHHYARHDAVVRAVKENHHLQPMLETLNLLLQEPRRLIQNEAHQRLNEAFEGLRSAYAIHYQERHDAYYRSLTAAPLKKQARRALAHLRLLSGIEALDRPEGLTHLLRRVDRPKQPACKRNLHEELVRAPVCNCGFLPDQVPESGADKDPTLEIEEMLDGYLRILRKPRVREAVSARVFALADAEPEKAGRLRHLEETLALPSPSVATLMDVLDQETISEIAMALAGSVTIEKRHIEDLLSQLNGRRLAPGQIVDIVKTWLSDHGENTIIALESDTESVPSKRKPALEWWPLLHGEFFRPGKMDGLREGREGIKAMENELERQYPASELNKSLSHADERQLLDFLTRDPLHTRALQQAWRIFIKRILSGESWPEKAPLPPSRHVQPETAASINERLAQIHAYHHCRMSPFPSAMGCRLPLSRFLVDEWTSAELREALFAAIREMEKAGTDWADTLSPPPPVNLEENPLVIILDGIPPDVWMAISEKTALSDKNMKTDWFRLAVEPQTVPATAAIFGFSGDPMEEFQIRNIPYHQVTGMEEQRLADLLPPFSPSAPAVVRVALADTGAHSGSLRLHEIPHAVARYMDNEIGPFLERLSGDNRTVILTTDHGLSLTRKGLAHGRGGLFETVVFRVEIRGGCKGGSRTAPTVDFL